MYEGTPHRENRKSYEFMSFVEGGHMVRLGNALVPFINFCLCQRRLQVQQQQERTEKTGGSKEAELPMGRQAVLRDVRMATML